MTATDRAFIRVFDHRTETADLAPHVLFAARGVQAPPAVAVTRAQAELSRNVVAARAPSITNHPSQPTTTAPRTAEAREKRRPAQRDDQQRRPTYLPSAFRNLVGIDEPHSAPEPPPTIAFVAAETDDERGAERAASPEVIGTQHATSAFRAALEVDALRWSGTIERLIRQHARDLGVLGEAVEQAVAREQRVIAFHSTSRRAGCTTMTLATARLLASTGCTVVVVDAEFLRPGLASAVGLVIEEGWERTLVSAAPLAESVIQSLADRLAIVPLARPCNNQVSGEALRERSGEALQALARHFDIVLVDAGCSAVSSFAPAGASASGISPGPDACVMVHAFDPHSNPADEPQVAFNCPLIGVVENLATTAGT